MKKTCCSLVVFALTAFSPLPLWSAAVTEADPADEASAPDPPNATLSKESPRTAGQALQTSAAQGHAEPETRNSAEDQPPPPPSTTTLEEPQGTSPGSNPASYHNWIEKVRAQRKARLEEHREAMEARRSYHAPWDPQYESIDMQREKLREARQMHNERREQAQREYRRWTNPHSEFMKDMHDARRQLMETEAEQQRMQADLLWQRQQDWMFGQMPHGWNNPWYFRGY